MGSKVIGASVMIGCMDPKIEVLLSLGTFVDPMVGDEVIGLRMVGAKVVVIGASVIGASVIIGCMDSTIEVLFSLGIFADDFMCVPL